MLRKIWRVLRGVKRRTIWIMRPVYEKIGVGILSQPSLNEIDKKLSNYLNYTNGIFLEIGANDGFKQSNTYYLEKIKNWEGILIEAIPNLYLECVGKRKKSQVFNCICDEKSNSGKFKKINFAGLMSIVEGAMRSNKKEKEHIKRGIEIQNIEAHYSCKIECRTLDEVIEDSKYSNFDFMSIDVEGGELSVLKGLSLSKYAPKYLLVEAWDHDRQEIINYLKPFYKIEAKFSQRDIFFKRNDLS